MNPESEKMYKGLIQLAVNLYNRGTTMTCDQLVEWINKYHPQKPPYQDYQSVRGVPQAAYRRAQSDSEKEALRQVFVGKNGEHLVKD